MVLKTLQKFYMNINNKIFVYGTLMDGFLQKVLPDVNDYIKKKKKARINSRLFDFGEYPGIKQTTVKTKLVHGQIYELHPDYVNDVLVKLDDYEEYNPERKDKSLYIRRLTPVVTEDGTISKAWVYWYNKPLNGENEIQTGDYKKYLRQNRLKLNGIK